MMLDSIVNRSMKRLHQAFFTLALITYFNVGLTAQSGSGTSLSVGTSTNTVCERTLSSLSRLDYPFTVATWMKLNANSGQAQWPIFQSSYVGNGYSGIVVGYSQNNDVYATMGNNNGYTQQGRRTILANVPGVFGKWVHIAVSVTGPTTADIYVNGAPRTTTTSGSGPANFHRPNNGTSRIGFRDSQLADHSLNGELDELSIWSKALSQTEVRDLMCQKLQGNEPDLEAYFRFDGTGNTVTDYSTNNLDFTFGGTTNFSRPISEAPVGEVSAYTYNVAQVSLSTPRGVTLTGYNNTGGSDGVHLYYNTLMPDQDQGLGSVCDSIGHFGRFIATNPNQPNIPGRISVSPAMTTIYTRPKSNNGTWGTVPVTQVLFFSDIYREFLFDPSQFIVTQMDRYPLCDSSTITAPPVFNASYAWSDGSNTRTINNPGLGQHWVTITSSCATITDTFEVYRDTVSDPFALTDTTLICPGDTGTLAVYNSPARPPIDSVVWADGYTGITRPVWNTGWYYAWVAVSGNCWQYDSTYVDFGNGTYYLGPDTTICKGDIVTLEVPGNAVNVQWSDGSSNLTLDVSQTGTYWVTFERNGCSLTDTIRIEAINFTINVQPSYFICTGTSATVTLNASSIPDSVIWSTGARTSTLQVSAGGSYSVQAYKEGCVASASFVVNEESGVNSVPSVDLVLCSGETALLSVNGLIPDEFADSLVWNTGQFGDSLIVDEGGTYIAGGASPCGPFSVNFFVEEVNCNVFLYIPTAFSPNGDGNNDTWRYALNGLESVRVEVMDRWGNRVFESYDVEGPYWDGTSGGTALQMGTYVYRIIGTTYAGQIVERSGYVNLLP